MIATCMQPMNFSVKRWLPNRRHDSPVRPHALRSGIPEQARRATETGIVLLDAADVRADCRADHARLFIFGLPRRLAAVEQPDQFRQTQR